MRNKYFSKPCVSRLLILSFYSYFFLLNYANHHYIICMINIAVTATARLLMMHLKKLVRSFLPSLSVGADAGQQRGQV
jgi:hypothetical protein